MKSIIIGIVTALIVAAVQAIRKSRKAKASNAALLDVGRILYPAHKAEFETFFNLFLTDKKKFIDEKESVLDDYFFEEDELRPLDIVYIFGDQKKVLFLTDWRGEENTREIEAFFSKRLNLSPTWTATDTLRATATKEMERDGKYIIDLFSAMDKDLGDVNKKLLFFYLGWDSYVYTAVDKATFQQIKSMAPAHFQGSNELR